MRKKFNPLNKPDLNFFGLEFLVILPTGKQYNHKWDDYLKENFEPHWIKDFSLFYSPKKNKRKLLNEKSIKKTRTNYTENSC